MEENIIEQNSETPPESTPKKRRGRSKKDSTAEFPEMTDTAANVSDSSEHIAEEQIKEVSSADPASTDEGGEKQSFGEQADSTLPSGNENSGVPAQVESTGKKAKEPWWKNKKEKKKQKWEKRHGKGGGGGQNPSQPLPPRLDEAPIGELPATSRFEDIQALDTLAAEYLNSPQEPVHINELYAKTLAQLKELAAGYALTFEGIPGRHQVMSSILKHIGEKRIPLYDTGWLDLTDQGYGFVVHDHNNYRLYPSSTYVPESLIRRYGLKRGHRVHVLATPQQENERCPAAIAIQSVMGLPPTEIAGITPFEELEPYYPLQRILLEAPEVHKNDISMRTVDLLTPIGFGQRGLLVAPPRTGKTVLLKNMANSISHNFPDKHLIILLIDERPEEVTDFKRHTRGEIVASTFDETPASHVHAAEMVIEKARRLVERGEHVIILLDSITRLARAYNALASNSGKIMSGGIEATALQKPKRFFGSARNIEGGGSLTIIGTALIDTNSRMDEVIFEEFKGTGNMELHLDRGLSDKRIFPAINIDRSGTRKEELIYHPDEMQRVYGLRRAMQGIPAIESMEMLIQRLRKTKTNAEFLMSLNR